MSHSSNSFSAPGATLRARHVTHDRGGRTVLRDVSLTLGSDSLAGVVGANGAGKSTLLQLLAGYEMPDDGSISCEPPTATVGYLAQEQDRRASESVIETLARRTGVADAERLLSEAATELSRETPGALARYEIALEQYETLGAADFEPRALLVLDDIGVGASRANQLTSSLSGGQETKVALACIELSRFDVMLLDEPTNDLDFEGLQRLERWVQQRQGATVVVSHDRDFLERTVRTVLEIDEYSHRAVEYGGGWAGYQVERQTARRLAREEYEKYDDTRRRLRQRAERQERWAVEGVRREIKNPRDNDKAQRDFRINRTEKQAHKARQTKRAIENLEPVEKPFEGWDLRFRIEETSRAGAVVARLDRTIVTRGDFTLGPVTLDIQWGDRVGVVGVNGSGKTTLVSAVLGEIAIDAGTRWIGPSVVVGYLGQDRRVLRESSDLVRNFTDRTGLNQSEARTLLAKFGLGANHVTRPASLLSPGERTRAELAFFQARGVNFLVLDEPTNHLDLPAIEQLEGAVRNFGGTMVLVSHDRRLLDSVELNRSIRVERGHVAEVT